MAEAGNIILNNQVQIKPNLESKNGFSFEINVPGDKIYHLVASSLEERDEWLGVITKIAVIKSIKIQILSRIKKKSTQKNNINYKKSKKRMVTQMTKFPHTVTNYFQFELKKILG